MTEIRTNLEKFVETAKSQVKNWESQWESLVELASSPEDAKKVTNEKFLQTMAAIGLGLRADIQALDARVAKLEELQGVVAKEATAPKAAKTGTAAKH